MFNLQKDTWIILNYNGKNKLAQVTSLSKSTVNAFLNDDYEKEEATTSIKVPMEMVLADLGIKPKLGSVHGVKVEPFYASEEYGGWGTIKYYRLMKGKEKKILYAALDRTFEILETKKLDSFPELDIKIHEYDGKHLGYYKHSKKEGINSTFGIQPPTFDIDEEDFDYLIWHEFGHVLWFNKMNSAIRAQWVKLFERRIKCKKFKQSELDKILQAIYSHADEGIRSFIKNEASEDEVELIKACMTYMNKIFKLSLDDIDLMLKEDNIDDYWPTQQAISKVFPDISQYSTKDCKEFMAESFAHSFNTEVKLPKDVRILLKETLATVKQY